MLQKSLFCVIFVRICSFWAQIIQSTMSSYLLLKTQYT